jgi:cytochrome b involved in lipid metabolism
MDEEFKVPKPPSHVSFLNVPEPTHSNPHRKSKASKPQFEFIRMMESNADPLLRQGRPFEVFSLEEVSKHNTETDAWIILDGKVYDMTLYLNYHPGGKIIMSCAGKDGSNFFKRYHPWVNIETLIGKLQVGVLERNYSTVSLS